MDRSKDNVELLTTCTGQACVQSTREMLFEGIVSQLGTPLSIGELTKYCSSLWIIVMVRITESSMRSMLLTTIRLKAKYFLSFSLGIELSWMKAVGLTSPARPLITTVFAF